MPDPNTERIVNEDFDFPPPGAPRRRADWSDVTLCMLGHAHIDLGYRWDYRETVHRLAPWTFRGVLDLMERVDGFTFCQSQAWLYREMQREYPELFARLLPHIRRGAWEFIGGAWCEFDAILPGGESIVRQYLQGVRYAEDCLGVKDHRVAFVPDSFCGHAATLPEILAGCGFRYYVFGRGLPQDPAHPERTRRAFRWTGRDGSRVVAYLPCGPYSTPPLTEETLANLSPYREAAVDSRELVLYGVGDHGGGPRDEDIAALKSLQNLPGAPAWRFVSAAGHLDEVFTPEKAASLPAHKGNLGGVSTGALTSQARMKRQNRLIERELLGAEALAAAAVVLQRKPAHPRVDFQELWREYLVHQFHDVLPGTSVAAVYRDVERSHGAIRRALKGLSDDALARIGARLDTHGDGRGLLVCQPGLAAARGLVEAPMPPDWAEGASVRVERRRGAKVVARAGRARVPVRLEDANGSPVEAEIEGGVLRFMASLPSLGYGLYRLKSGVGTRRRAIRSNWKNGFLRTEERDIVFDRKTGDLLSVTDRSTGRDWLKGRGNTLMLFEEHEGATSWVERFTGVRRGLEVVTPPTVTERNGFFTRVETVARSRDSVFTREVTVWRDVRRIDFCLSTDWRECSAFLKIGFRPALGRPTVEAALPFGSARVEWPAREFCVHDYVLLRDGRRAFAFLNDGSHAANFSDGVLGLSVVRNARDMDPTMDHGRHELRYAMVPFDSSVAESEVRAELESFLAAFACRWESAHPGGIAAWGGWSMLPALPPGGAFLSVDAPNVLPCAFKLPEEAWTPEAFVARVRETDGKPTDCTLALPAPVRSAVRADHLERPGPAALAVTGNRVELSLRPFEIATIMAYL